MIPHWWHSAPTAFGLFLILVLTVCLWAVIHDMVRKSRRRNDNVVPFRKRAGWGMVDYRGVSRAGKREKGRR